jgi:oxygen-dependent protoporphyrinogen oxidase
MTPAFEPYDAVVAGAGISGLTCARALKGAGLHVLLLEAGDDAGGCISSVRRDACTADGGPQTFAGVPAFMDLVAALGLDHKLQRAKAGTPFFFSRGRLEPAPTSPGTFFASPLLSPAAKLRLLAEPFIGARVSGDDESVAAFASRRAGPGVVDALVRPMLNGIFAGDPSRLSVRSAFPGLVESERRYSSVMIGAIARRRKGGGRRPEPLNFAGGNDALIQALVADVAPDIRLGIAVNELVLRGAHMELVYDGAASGSVVARHVVLALPAYESGRLLARLEPEAAEALRAIPYVPVAQVALSYGIDEVDADMRGFGFLSGEDSSLRILGCTWNSSMFDDRCPSGRVLVTAFLGGTTDPEIARLRDDEIVSIAHRDLQRALGIDVAPVVVAGFRWDRAIPQLEVGHTQRLATIAYGMSRLPQMTLIGNYFKGPSVPDCIAISLEAAGRVVSGAVDLHGRPARP